MKRVLSIIATVTAITLLAGCLEVGIELTVSQDGSGQITVKTMMSAQSAAQMGGKEINQKQLYNVDNLKKSASNFGKGVKYVSSKYIEKQDGSKGVIAIYSFEDINNVSIKGQAASGGMGDDSFPWKFKFDKATRKLTIVGLKKDQPKPEPSKISDAEISAKMQQVKMLCKGMKINVTIKGETPITSTTATHFDKKTNTVTLMLFDLDSVINDDAKLRKLMKSDGMGDMADPNMPGVKAQDPTKDAIIQL